MFQKEHIPAGEIRDVAREVVFDMHETIDKTPFKVGIFYPFK